MKLRCILVGMDEAFIDLDSTTMEEKSSSIIVVLFKFVK